MKRFLNKKALIAACALALLGGGAATFAQTDAERLEAEKSAKSHELAADDRDLRLLPQTEFSQAIKEYVFGAWTDKCGHALEKVYAVPKAGLRAGFNIQAAGELMRSISKMQGMLYYSRSDKDWGVLYSSAYRIQDAQSDAAIADDTAGSADAKTVYAFMDDHTFGKAKYKITYKQTQKQLVMFMENISPLCYGPLKAVQPGGFKICASVIDDGENFLVYTCDYAEFKIISALKRRLYNSFEARLEAICLWFVKNAR